MTGRLSEDNLQLASGFVLAKGWGEGKGEESVTVSSGPRLKNEKREKMKDIFRTFDKDNSGTISRGEFAAVLQRLGKIPAEEIDELMNEADTNKNGMLEIEEFVDWLCADQTDGKVLFEYGEALKPLFNAFDRIQNGLISMKEFTDCHTILQGALLLNPVEDEEEDRRDPFSLTEDATALFRSFDKNGDENLSFTDFAAYAKGMVAESGISSADLSIVVKKLADALNNAFKGIKMAESGLIAEDEPEKLEAMIRELADSTREVNKTLSDSSAKGPTHQTQWTNPPAGMRVADLKVRHMALFPLNMRLVEDFDYSITCVPAPGGLSDPESRSWLAEISRTITYTSRAHKKEAARIYNYDRSSAEWTLNNRANAHEIFTGVLKSFTPELGIFCMLETTADFGIELTWDEVKRSLIACVDMGWLTTDQRMKFNTHVENMAGADVQKYLSQLQMRPRLVMAILTKLRIVDINKAWSAFMNKV